AAVGPGILDSEITTFDEACLGESLAEPVDHVLGPRRRGVPEKPDHRHRRLLRARLERPCGRRAAQAANEISTIERTARHVFPRLAGRHPPTLSPKLVPVLGTSLKCSESRRERSRRGGEGRWNGAGARAGLIPGGGIGQGPQQWGYRGLLSDRRMLHIRAASLGQIGRTD